MEASMESIQKIVDEHQADELRWPDGETLHVDAFTASMLVKVREKLRPDQQEKVDQLIAKSQAHFLKVVDTAWEAVS